MKRAQFFLCGLLLSSWSLSGCSTTARAGFETVAQALRGSDPEVESATLNPQLNYLRVQIGRQVGLMARADEQPSSSLSAPHMHSEPSRWYSADGVVLRFAQGRIVALNDGARSWACAESSRPVDWRQVAAGQVQRWREVSDQQPGYRFGQVRERELRLSFNVPPFEVMEASRHVTAPVTWFEERNVSGEPQSAWYAVDLSLQAPRVVYGQTCLQDDWCLNWQVWPPQVPHAPLQTAIAP